MLMREVLGKTVSIRPEPLVTADKLGTLEPLSTVTAVEVVDDRDHPGDLEYQWLNLEDGTFVNYIYPPAGLRFDWLDAPRGPTFPFDLYRVRWDFQVYPTGSASRPAFQRPQPFDHTLLDETCRTCGSIRSRSRGGAIGDDLRHAWRWLTASNRFIPTARPGRPERLHPAGTA
jgi:hypothetical protein